MIFGPYIGEDGKPYLLLPQFDTSALPDPEDRFAPVDPNRPYTDEESSESVKSESGQGK